jgi:hypothetical protein
MFKDDRAYLKHAPTVVNTIEMALDNLSKIKKVATGNDERFHNLKENMFKTSWYRKP